MNPTPPEPIEVEPLTWRELKEFLNSLPDEKLDVKVAVFVDDETYCRGIKEAAASEEDIYVNNDDEDDSGPLEILKDAHGDEFVESDYYLHTKKGTPFLYLD